jgi:hypothetical protein
MTTTMMMMMTAAEAAEAAESAEAAEAAEAATVSLLLRISFTVLSAKAPIIWALYTFNVLFLSCIEEPE